MITTTIPAPITGTAIDAAHTLTIPAQTITVAGQSVVIPAQTVPLPARTETVTGTAAIPVSTDLTALAAAVAVLLGHPLPTVPPTPTPKAITIVPLVGANVVAIGSPGVPITLGGGIDGGANVYSVAQLGTSLVGPASLTSGTFVLGISGIPNGAANVTIPLPQANFSALKLLATGVNGNQPGQVFKVAYTDGTIDAVTQSLSDWFTPQKYAGEVIAATTDARLIATGAAGTGPAMLYGYSLALTGTKTAKSLTLPATRNVVVVAILAVP
jgi:hypothetical protein